VSFTIAVGPPQRSHSRVRTVSDSILPQHVGPGTLFISTWNRVAQLYTQALGSLFVASYDSQGYGGGI
jgi:hypothetical protein